MGYLLLLLCHIVFLPKSADELAVREILASREESWVKKDIEGLTRAFTDDSDYIDSSGNVTSGRSSIMELYKKIFANAQYKNTRSTQVVKKIRFVKPDIAIVEADWTLSGLLSNENLQLPDRKGTSVLVMIKESGAWKIVTIHVAQSMPTGNNR